MIDRTLLKQALVVLSSACGGFYLGGRYVGGLAITEYMGSKPGWLGQAQSTMGILLAVAGVSVLLWIVLDHSEQ